MESWTLVIFPILLGTTGMALNQILRRYFMRGKPISALQLLIHLNIALGLCFGLVYLLFWGFSMPKTLDGFWRAVIFGAAANVLIQFLNVKVASFDKGEVSLTAPLQAMTPGLITVMAVLLGEFPSKVGCAGIFLMMCGSYVLLWEEKPQHWYEYFGPLKRLLLLLKLGRLTPQEKDKTIVVSLALGSACLGTIGLIFDGLYTRRGTNTQGLTMALMVLFFLLALSYVLWFFLKPDSATKTRSLGISIYNQRKYQIAMIGMLAMWIVVMFSIQPTFNHTLVAYTGTLKRFSILMAVLMGFLFFKEQEFKKRFWAAILIIAGAILISTDDLPSRISTQIQGWGL